MTDYHCWQCGATLEELIFPISRREECRRCRAEIHVCRMCVHWAPQVSDQCREDRAEPPSDKTAANFCDYFKANPDAWQGPAAADREARSKLDQLFGDNGDSSDEAGESKSKGNNPLDDLFDL
ncbi:MAG: hypothetical protein R3200_01155 [Xanthomonadales bacterium]|nr:hypothetical protein [Xanthomonadales bacterium]